MRKVIPAIFAIALAVASCSNPDNDAPVETSSSAASSASTAASSSEPTSTTSTTSTTAVASSEDPTSEATEPAPAIEQSPTETATEVPQFQQESIFNPPGVGYRCPATDAYVNDPANCTAANLGGDPRYDQMYPGGYPADQVPFADGGTCPAAICGYGHDENGNPNPSSGELQTMHGCEEGYITDQDLCSRVSEKAAQYGW